MSNREVAGIMTLMAVLALTTSCGDKEEEEGSFCSDIAEVMCHNMFSCCTGAQIEDSLGISISTNEKDCRHDMNLLCEKAYAAVLYGLDKQTVTQHDDALDECLEAIRVGAECFPVIVDPAYETACAGSAFTGNVSPGNDCVYQVECQENSFCAPNQTCVGLLGKGDDCGGSSVPCASGLFCGYHEGYYICRELRAKGQSCIPYVEPCQEDLFCDFADGTGECVSKRSVGQSCKSHEACASDYCIPGLCSGNSDTCYDDSHCPGECEGTDSYCDSDWPCQGTCEMGGNYCSDDDDCYYYEGDTCLIPACLGAECLGDPTCADKHVIVDHCDIGLGLMSMF